MRGAFDGIDELAARAALVRVALVHHRFGADAARATAETTGDPLGSGSLRWNRDDGRFRVWSVGLNGVDEQGRTLRQSDGNYDDVVIELRER